MLDNSPWLRPLAACLFLSGCAVVQGGPREPTGAGIAALREGCLNRLSHAAAEYPSIKAAVLREIEARILRMDRPSADFRPCFRQ